MNWKNVFIRSDDDLKKSRRPNNKPNAPAANPNVQRGQNDALQDLLVAARTAAFLSLVFIGGREGYKMYNEQANRVNGEQSSLSPQHPAEGVDPMIDPVLWKKLQEATPVMRTKKGDNYAAFFAAPNIVVTANHCLLDGDTLSSITIKNVGYRQHGYEEIWHANYNNRPIVVRDIARDLAVLIFPSQLPHVDSSRILRLTNDTESHGKESYACGHPFGKKNIVSGGRAMGYMQNGFGLKVEKYVLPLEPGNSGGPITDANGVVRAVAILTEYRTRSEEGYGSPITFELIQNMVTSGIAEFPNLTEQGAERHCFVNAANPVCFNVK